MDNKDKELNILPNTGRIPTNGYRPKDDLKYSDIVSEKNKRGSLAAIEKAEQESLNKKQRRINTVLVATGTVLLTAVIFNFLMWASTITEVVDARNGVHRDKNGATLDDDGNYIEIPSKDYWFPSAIERELARQILLGKITIEDVEMGYTGSYVTPSKDNNYKNQPNKYTAMANYAMNNPGVNGHGRGR